MWQAAGFADCDIDEEMQMGKRSGKAYSMTRDCKQPNEKGANPKHVDKLLTQADIALSQNYALAEALNKDNK